MTKWTPAAVLRSCAGSASPASASSRTSVSTSRDDLVASGRAGDARISLARDEHGGVTVVVDGQPQSYVQPDDPRLLAFEYVQHLALAIEACCPHPPTRLAVTHVGGAGLTLPRWVEATRPGSPQIVLEPDEALTAFVREALPLPRRHRIRVRPQDGLTGVCALETGSADVLVTDAYAAGRVPAELTSATYLRAVARVVKPTGPALWNLADEPGFRWGARMVAAIRACLPEVAIVATHEVLKGKRFGNTVVIAGHRPLPIGDLRRRVAGAPLPTGLRDGDSLRRMLAGAKPFDDQGEMGPPAPEAKGWRVV
ncbi:MAG: fused MFS/spermidine synthase [Intrasporangium sp.]|uniref:spermidine synthase n=1 Tax=Intrasporangium sp. TaxID=1925024 RepID=UPI002648A982|nr:fused MFS/spermidine synthase [Intrasporangium sp.]MDN5796126.1 fused MFS/spermidine synthase [Intrasporangium sp.]